MKSKLIFIVALVVGLALAGGHLFWLKQLQPVAPGNKDETTIVIPKSQAASITLAQLEEKNIIKSALVARLYLRLHGLSQKMQNGTFVVSGGQTLSQVIDTLMLPPKDIWVTIPEGWRREQIAMRFAAELTGPEAAFSASEFLTESQGLEGHLFPDTYLLPRYSTAADVVKIMTTNFNKRVTNVSKEALILASLVEREGKTNSDRPVIAGILSNRLKAGWPLQVDATVQYASVKCTIAMDGCDWWPNSIDTKLPSIYNTYLHTGLPPTPIANPGLNAIMAAINPETTSFWYYLHDSNGVAHYAASLSEHNANIDKYLNH